MSSPKRILLYGVSYSTVVHFKQYQWMIKAMTSRFSQFKKKKEASKHVCLKVYMDSILPMGLSILNWAQRGER